MGNVRGRKPSTRTVASKLCIRCNRVLPLGDFYPNRDWQVQMYRDAWCKECATKYCYDKDTIEQYCYENNRQWDDSFYDAAMKKAQYSQATNSEYLSPQTSAKKKEEIAGRCAAKQFFSLMNMRNFYGYVENVNSEAIDGTTPAKVQKAQREANAAEEAREVAHYNKKWRGYFTEEQIQSLEDTYAQYEEDFVLDNVNLRDYAMKVAKASLNADIAEDKMRRGEISASEYKEVQKIFDDLSKSANFAACKRKAGESTGLGSLGEIVLRIESTGRLKTDGFHWPDDSVDKAVAEYRHSLIAAGLEGVL